MLSRHFYLRDACGGEKNVLNIYTNHIKFLAHPFLHRYGGDQNNIDTRSTISSADDNQRFICKIPNFMRCRCLRRRERELPEKYQLVSRSIDIGYDIIRRCERSRISANTSKSRLEGAMPSAILRAEKNRWFSAWSAYGNLKFRCSDFLVQANRILLGNVGGNVPREYTMLIAWLFSYIYEMLTVFERPPFPIYLCRYVAL